MAKKRHKWDPVYNEGIRILYGKDVVKRWVCSVCGCEKRMVMKGVRYDLNGETYWKTPVCDENKLK